MDGASFWTDFRESVDIFTEMKVYSKQSVLSCITWALWLIAAYQPFMGILHPLHYYYLAGRTGSITCS